MRSRPHGRGDTQNSHQQIIRFINYTRFIMRTKANSTGNPMKYIMVIFKHYYTRHKHTTIRLFNNFTAKLIADNSRFIDSNCFTINLIALFAFLSSYLRLTYSEFKNFEVQSTK